MTYLPNPWLRNPGLQPPWWGLLSLLHFGYIWWCLVVYSVVYMLGFGRAVCVLSPHGPHCALSSN